MSLSGTPVLAPSCLRSPTPCVAPSRCSWTLSFRRQRRCSRHQSDSWASSTRCQLSMAGCRRGTSGGLPTCWRSSFPTSHSGGASRPIPQLPRSFYDEAVSMPSQWWTRPTANLQLSPAYDDERTRAERWRWPTSRLAGSHLDLCVLPDLIADQIIDLVRRLEPGAC